MALYMHKGRSAQTCPHLEGGDHGISSCTYSTVTVIASLSHEGTMQLQQIVHGGNGVLCAVHDRGGDVAPLGCGCDDVTHAV